jgi:predicted molibdopterin-dependent oxidoreductase YjgC
MVHGLAAFLAGIDDDAVALRQAFLPSNFPRYTYKVTEQCSLFCTHLGERTNVLAWNDKDVHRRLGVDVGKSVDLPILIHGGCGNLSGSDFAKDAIHGVSSVQRGQEPTTAYNDAMAASAPFRIVHTVCSHDCPDSCAVLVTVNEEGRAVKVEGDPSQPVTRGFLCGKVAKYLDRVYAPDRVLYPLKR